MSDEQDKPSRHERLAASLKEQQKRQPPNAYEVLLAENAKIYQQLLDDNAMLDAAQKSGMTAEAISEIRAGIAIVNDSDKPKQRRRKLLRRRVRRRHR